jgi:hypothetical protein
LAIATLFSNYGGIYNTLSYTVLRAFFIQSYVYSFVLTGLVATSEWTKAPIVLQKVIQNGKKKRVYQSASQQQQNKTMNE